MTFARRVARRVDERALPHLLRTLWGEIFNDHATVVAAGLAYYGLFGLLPALAAAAAMWGVFGNVSALRQLVQGSSAVLPAAAIQVVQQFITSVPQGFGGGIALALNLLAVVWTAFRAAAGLLTALNIVYDVKETRSTWRCACTALAVGTGGIVLLFLSIAFLALLPLAANRLRRASGLDLLALRWPIMILVFAAALGALFRCAPNRTDAHLPSLCWGLSTATVLCIASSAGISLYVGHISNFGRLYGSLGGIAIVLLWFYATALALLIGAEVDATLSERAKGEPETVSHTDEGQQDGAASQPPVTPSDGSPGARRRS